MRVAAIAVAFAFIGCTDDNSGLERPPLDLSVDLPPPPDLVAARCDDYVQNGAETDIDCGGPDCRRCPFRTRCIRDSDCACSQDPLPASCVLALHCIGGFCGTPCLDRMQNGDETDLDCGGLVCEPCEVGQKCLGGPDCSSRACLNNVCIAPTCDDGVRNQDETDRDCGGATCPARCPEGARCWVATDCIPRMRCAGLCVKLRGKGEPCQGGDECLSGQCFNNQCMGAALGGACFFRDDCANGGCFGGICRLPPGQACQMDSQCSSGRCVNGVCALGVAGEPCAERTDCTLSLYCVAETCLVRPNGSCTMDRECSSGKCLQGGRCDYGGAGAPCFDRTDCANFDCTNSRCQ